MFKPFNKEDKQIKYYSIKIKDSNIFHDPFEFIWDDKISAVRSIPIKNGINAKNVEIIVSDTLPIYTFILLMEIFCFRDSLLSISFLTYDNRMIVSPVLEDFKVDNPKFVDGSGLIRKLFTTLTKENKPLHWSVMFNNGLFLAYDLEVSIIPKHKVPSNFANNFALISHDFDYKNAVFSIIDDNERKEILKNLRKYNTYLPFLEEFKVRNTSQKAFVLNKKFTDDDIIDFLEYGLDEADDDEDEFDEPSTNTKNGENVFDNFAEGLGQNFGFPLNIDQSIKMEEMFENMVEELYNAAKSSGISDEDMETYFREYFSQFAKITPTGFANNKEMLDKLIAMLKNVQKKNNKTSKNDKGENTNKKDISNDDLSNEDKEIN